MFIRKGRRAVLPARSDPNYDKVLRTRHAAVLGLIALIRAYPFTVPEWMPPLIDYLSKYATDPSPISNTLRTFGAEFQKTHQVWGGSSSSFPSLLKKPCSGQLARRCQAIQ
jgi:proteasome activator subunit 4